MMIIRLSQKVHRQHKAIPTQLTPMETNLVAQLLESNVRMKKILLNPPKITMDESVIIAHRDSIIGNQHSSIQNSKQANIEMKGYIVTISGVKLHMTGGMLSTSKFVVYVLTVTNISNGAVHYVEHRFRDIKAFYYEVGMMT